MPPSLIDNVHRVETPEGVVLELPVASALPRALALVIDTIAQVLVFYAGAFFFGVLSGLLGISATGPFLIVIFLLLWFYFTLSEWRFGTTLGKRAMNLRVVQYDGSALTFGSSFTRNLLRFVDSFPALLSLGTYTPGVVSSLWSRSFQRLGDHVAGTLVVHHSPPPRRLKKRKSEDEQVLTEPVPFPLTPQERRAILEFEGRHSTWSRERQVELADTLSPLTGSSGSAGVKTLLAMAAWIRAGDK